MDQYSYISLKAIILLILALSVFARILYMFVQIPVSTRLKELFFIYNPKINLSNRQSKGSSVYILGYFNIQYLFLSIEILLIGLVMGEKNSHLGGILAISYFLVPAILFRFFAKCLPFNLFYRNVLIGFFSIALLFEFPEQNFHWMDYYSVTLLTLVSVGTYSIMNYILHQYNRDSNPNLNIQTKS
jgi:hypothetical protein